MKNTRLISKILSKGELAGSIDFTDIGSRKFRLTGKWSQHDLNIMANLQQIKVWSYSIAPAKKENGYQSNILAVRLARCDVQILESNFMLTQDQSNNWQEQLNITSDW